MINKDLMKDRVKMYGNNFPYFAKLVEEYYGSKIEVTPADAAAIMALLKQARVLNTKERLEKVTLGTEEHMALLKHYEDSIVDRDNYTWISEHYEEYLQLI